MNWLVFFVLFAVFYAAGQRGAAIGDCTLFGILFQVTYMFFSILAGHLLNKDSAKRYLLMSICAAAVSAVLCLYVSSVFMISSFLLCLGVGTAFFFNGFQAYMRTNSDPGTLKRNIGYYNCSWSSGGALGTISAGLMYSLGFYGMASVVLFSALLMFCIIFLRKSRQSNAPSAEEHVEHGSEKARPVNSVYVLTGWLMMFTLLFVQRPLFTFLPPLFAEQGISSEKASIPLFLYMAAVAMFSLVMFIFRDFLYRRTPIWSIQLCGVFALLLIYFIPAYPVCSIGMLLIGLYSGFMFYSAIYYASNSGARPFNVGVNESMVASGSIAGIFAGDIAMRLSGSGNSIYLICAAVLLISFLIQISIPSFAHKSPLKKLLPVLLREKA